MSCAGHRATVPLAPGLSAKATYESAWAQGRTGSGAEVAELRGGGGGESPPLGVLGAVRAVVDFLEREHTIVQHMAVSSRSVSSIGVEASTTMAERPDDVITRSVPLRETNASAQPEPWMFSSPSESLKVKAGLSLTRSCKPHLCAFLRMAGGCRLGRDCAFWSALSLMT